MHDPPPPKGSHDDDDDRATYYLSRAYEDRLDWLENQRRGRGRHRPREGGIFGLVAWGVRCTAVAALALLAYRHRRSWSVGVPRRSESK